MALPDGLIVVQCACAPGGSRELARQRIRRALRQALAQRWHEPESRIEVIRVPGKAPRLTLGGAPCEAGVSISHEAGLSIAAANLHGALGVDLMLVQPIPDWQAVARDYLGPDVAARLDGDPHAFARAWTEREARLKCAGLPLREWTALEAERTAGCRCFAIDLPDGFVGTVAVFPDAR